MLVRWIVMAVSVGMLACLAGCGGDDGGAAAKNWPSNPAGLVFAYKGPQDIFAIGPGGKPLKMYEMDPLGLSTRGLAMTDRNRALVLRKGSYQAKYITPHLARAFREANALSIEAYVAPDNLSQGGPAEIISFASGPERRNFSLCQQGRGLLLFLATSAAGDGAGQRIGLFELSDAKPYHLVVTFSPGLLVCYRDGKEVFRSSKIKGDLTNWKRQHLVLGSDYQAKHGWSGRLEGVALYARALEAEEVKRNFRSYQAKIEARPKVPVLRIRARLLERSDTPALSETDPYFRVLTLYRYKLEKIIKGAHEGDEIYVAHWTVVRNCRLAFADAPVGASYVMTVEPVADNMQLESANQSNTLGSESFDLPWYYDAGGLSVTYEPAEDD